MPFQSTGTRVTATYTQFEFQNISFRSNVLLGSGERYSAPPDYYWAALS